MAVLLNLKVIVFVSSLCCKSTVLVFGFPPQPITGAFSTTHSHRDITFRGIYIAVATFLKENGLINNLVTPIADYFGSDKDKEEDFDRMIDEITASANRLQISGRQTAKYSVNGEQIQAAHDFIVKTRAEMKKVAQGLKTNKARKLLLEKTGHCLYVIQSFYSSTNWVEMKGSTPYYEFGLPGKTLMPLALPNDATCKGCGRSGPYAIGSCKSSLLVENLLTSGYREGQDIYKPNLNLGTGSGKCSHGGENDPTFRTIPAVGGINKETLNYETSPRADLHNKAANASAFATSHFLIGTGGVLDDMGKDTFMWVYSLNVRTSNTSLTFIIDVSGSMSDEINAVIEDCTQLVTDVQNTVNEPENYVLVTFNDPESLTNSWVTGNYSAMLSLLNALVADGGGDCPEYAMHGILRGINESNAGSELFVFTDADPIDCHRYNEVKDAAREKEMKITFILTGSCPSTSTCVRQRRSAVNNARYKREALSVYQDISDATGGTVYNTNKAQIKEVLGKIIIESFPSSKVIIHAFTHPREESDQLSVFVDKDVNLLKIQINGAQAATEADITDPKGVLHSFSNATSTKIYISNSLIMSIQNPLTGKWTLVRNAKRNWEVNVTAEANMDIGVQVIETDDNGFAAETEGNPVAGKNYTVFVVVSNILPNITSTTITLLNKDGSDYLSLPVEPVTSDLGTYARINIIVPSKEFGVQFKGVDSSGNIFMRTSGKIVSPVAISLTLHKILDDLQTGEPQKLGYTVTNFGKSSETLQVTFTDDKEYYKNVSNMKTYNLTTNQRIEDYFEITGLKDSEIVEYTISVRLNGSTTNLQSPSNRIVFTTKVHPSCVVTNEKGNCTISVDCSTVIWLASAQIVYSGVTLKRLYLSNADTDVHISYDNYTNGISPTHVNITGTCCSPSVYINAVDNDNYDARCHFYFGDPYNVTLPEIPSTTTSTTESATTEPSTSRTESTTTELSTTTAELTTTETSIYTTESTTAKPSTSTTETTATPSASTTEPTSTQPSTSTTETTTLPSTSTTEITTRPSTSTTEPTTTLPSTSTTKNTTRSSTSTTEPTTTLASAFTAETTTLPSTFTTETTALPSTSTTEPTTAQPSTSTTELTTTQPSTSTTKPTTIEPSTSTTKPTTTQSSTSTTLPTTTQPSTSITEPTTIPVITTTTELTTTELSTSTTEPSTTQLRTSLESTTTEQSTSTTESTTSDPSTSTTEATTTELDGLNEQQTGDAGRNMIIITTSVMVVLLICITIGLAYTVWKIKKQRVTRREDSLEIFSNIVTYGEPRPTEYRIPRPMFATN